MRNCVCGTAIHDGSTLCAQCAALQELGLAAGATLNEVKAAYKMLVKVWHPDRFQGDHTLAQAAEAKLKAINTAFSYLTSNGYKGGATPKPEAAPRPAPGGSAQQTAAAEPPTPERPQPSAKVRVSPVRRRGGAGFWPRLGFRLLMLALALGIGAFLFKIADAAVAADPTTGRYYVGFKSQLKSDFQAAWERISGNLERAFPSILRSNSGTAPVAAPVTSEPAAPTPEAVTSAGGQKRPAQEKPAVPLRLLPYVTLGLTRDEAIAAQGPPTSSSDDKLMYNASELDLKDGKVVGWKIDPRSSLRVKLWPEGPVDTSLRSFTVGSSKDEVLVVQGTPTSFTHDRFDYGSSAVYFRDNRVVAWKDGPGPVRLRADR
jgi:curved DNA-binding protein CbpA